MTWESQTKKKRNSQVGKWTKNPEIRDNCIFYGILKSLFYLFLFYLYFKFYQLTKCLSYLIKPNQTTVNITPWHLNLKMVQNDLCEIIKSGQFCQIYNLISDVKII